MIARLRPYAAKLARTWVCWTSFKAGFFVGSLVTMPIMAIVIIACFTAPDAVQLLAHKVLP